MEKPLKHITDKKGNCIKVICPLCKHQREEKAKTREWFASMMDDIEYIESDCNS